MSVFFYVKAVKIRWRLGAKPPDPFGLRRLRGSSLDPQLWPPLPNPGCATGTAYYFCVLFLC